MKPSLAAEKTWYKAHQRPYLANPTKKHLHSEPQEKKVSQSFNILLCISFTGLNWNLLRNLCTWCPPDPFGRWSLRGRRRVRNFTYLPTYQPTFGHIIIIPVAIPAGAAAKKKRRKDLFIFFFWFGARVCISKRYRPKFRWWPKLKKKYTGQIEAWLRFCSVSHIAACGLGLVEKIQK